MAVREILRMGHPLLLERARPVDKFGTPELQALLEDMQDTMAAENGAGLAAPQIGASVQVVIFGVRKTPRYPDADEIPFTTLVNPVLEPLGNEMEEGWEGCLSVPGMRGAVPRFTKLRYSGFDENGVRIERIAEGWHARVVQHECDHLLGVLYPMRIRNMANFGFTEVLFPELAGAEDD
jgi:peptide deformylase